MSIKSRISAYSRTAHALDLALSTIVYSCRKTNNSLTKVYSATAVSMSTLVAGDGLRTINCHAPLTIPESPLLFLARRLNNNLLRICFKRVMSKTYSKPPPATRSH
ncbi:hypothetical protein H109_04980 [Trichophyton interdigitale MR816]|uniref:Uncharacterized protein n=1 Tax=Trichophyton interdigitale (strain MR816) TaxID=1215338 RepID=A0A059J5P9_TRIIM|nr:hypothetical protein H109_04980 [Trichophyton interdigitale MR816]